MSNKIAITQPDGTELVLYEPTPKQEEFHSRLEPNVLFWGGRGSGKSMALRWEAHARALSHPGFKYCILRRTFPELQKSHLVHVPKEMKLLGGDFNYTQKIARYPNGSTGFFSHCATDEDVLNLLSSEFAWMGFDELSTFEWEQFVKLAASVRVPVDSELIAMVRGATNPLGPSAQKILQYFVSKDVDPSEDPDYNPDDWYSVKANLEDNPHLDQFQYRKRFSGLPEHVRKAWVDGDFVLENALFDFHPTVTQSMIYEKGLSQDTLGKPYHVIHDIDLDKIIKASTIYRAIDAGWFPDPTVCLWIAHLGNRHIVFHEKIWYKTVVDDIVADIKDEDKRLGVKSVAMTYCDPSMDINTTADIRTVKEKYEALGIPMECSINKRDAFATVIHQTLAEESLEGTPRIQFYHQGSRGCPYLVKTIPQMRFDPKRPAFMDDHKDDHAVVALAYYLLSHSADPRNFTSVIGGKFRPWMKPKQGEIFRLGSDNVRERRDFKY